MDAAWSQVDNTGEEVVGGTAQTPDQDIVDELGAAVGLERDDRQPLRVHDEMEKRDRDRWELEPKSSDDYKQRRKIEEHSEEGRK